jgi:hypothetical protein
VKSHAMSEYDEGGSTDVEDVAPGLCSRPVPTATCVAGSRSVGCEARGKAQGSLSRPEVTGEGKVGRVNNSELLLMPRQAYFPGRIASLGRIGLADEKRQAAVMDVW